MDWAGGPVARLTLHWRPLAKISQDLKVSLRVQAPDGTPRLQADGQPAADDHFPLRGVASTSSWVPGAAVTDVYEAPLSAVRSPDDRLLVIVYDAGTLAELGRFDLPLAGSIASRLSCGSFWELNAARGIMRGWWSACRIPIGTSAEARKFSSGCVVWPQNPSRAGNGACALPRSSTPVRIEER